MSGYFGTQTQQRLQAQAEASAEFINVTPGACGAGYPYSWDRIHFARASASSGETPG